MSHHRHIPGHPDKIPMGGFQAKLTEKLHWLCYKTSLFTKLSGLHKQPTIK